MYKTIVVGTDGSDRARVAEDHAIELARTFGAQLCLVHVLPDRPRQSRYTMDAAARSEIELSQEFDQGDVVTAAALARAEAQGVTGRIYSPIGDPADLLVAIAKSEGADLVVLGNRGMSGLRRFVLGNVPSRIAHRCPCNLLVVDTDDHGQTDAH